MNIEVIKHPLSIIAAACIAASAYGQTTSAPAIPPQSDSETALSLSMWAAQTAPGSVRLEWNHIDRATGYVVSCAYNSALPRQVTTIDAAGIAPRDASGSPHRFTTTIEIRQSTIPRCYLQWRKGARGVLSARLPFNEITPLHSLPVPAGTGGSAAVGDGHRYRSDSSSWAPTRVRTAVDDSLYAIVAWVPVQRATGYEVFRALQRGKFESIGYVNAPASGSQVEFRDYLGGFVTSRHGVTARYAVRAVDEGNLKSALVGSSPVTIPAGTIAPARKR